MTSPSQGSPSGRAMGRYFVLWIALAAIHMSLLSVFIPFGDLASSEPILDIDYALHYYQAQRAQEAFEQSGKLWSWDPSQLAGYPTGAIEDMSARSLQIFVIALAKLGVPLVTAFNLYAFLLVSILPLLALLAAWLYRLSDKEGLILGVLWVLLWHFDSFIHWSWYCGMLSWALVIPGSVVVVGFLYRLFDALGGDEKTSSMLVGGILASSMISFLHPLGVVVVAPPAAALYFRAIRRDGGFRPHVFAALAALGAIAASLVWLLPSLPFWRYVEGSHIFLRPTPDYFMLDWLEFQISKAVTGPSVQTGVRFVVFAAGGYGLWRWRKAHDARMLPVAIIFLGGVFLAYFGRYVPGASTAQPYRFVGPAAMIGAIPAAIVFAELFSRKRLGEFSSRGRALLVVVLVLVMPRMVRTVAYFWPGVGPYEIIEQEMYAPRHPINVVLGARQLKLQNHKVSKTFRKVRRWLLDEVKPKGRILVERYELGEYLAATTNLPILGGFAYRPFYHGDANFFQYQKARAYSRYEFRSYLERYAVSMVILEKVAWKLENDTKVLKFAKSFERLRFRAFHVRSPSDYFLRGHGRVVHQGINRVDVQDVRGDEVVLRFHWLASLRCEPACRVERYPVEGDRVGFLRIPSPPSKFRIYNSYHFP
ncbi:MAG: hypothetical protein KAI47_14815 [Deltaproteobacteria bacterium]|nr:hypothetical protein [Deltaproteobacteria bacterium]